MAHLRSLITGVLLWVLVLAPAGAWAEKPLVLLSTAGNSYAALLGALQRHYQHPLESRILSTEQQPEAESRLVIAIGSQACVSALENMGAASPPVLPLSAGSDLREADRHPPRSYIACREPIECSFS